MINSEIKPSLLRFLYFLILCVLLAAIYACSSNIPQPASYDGLPRIPINGKLIDLPPPISTVSAS